MIIKQLFRLSYKRSLIVMSDGISPSSSIYHNPSSLCFYIKYFAQNTIMLNVEANRHLL